MPFHLPHLEDIISRLRAASYAVRLYGGIATLCGLNTLIVQVILLLRRQFIYVLYLVILENGALRNTFLSTVLLTKMWTGVPQLITQG
jgi:hypothetical protein